MIGYRQGGKWHKADHLGKKDFNLTMRRVELGRLTGSYAATGFEPETEGPEGVFLNGPEEGRQGALYSGSVSFPRKVHVLSNGNDVYLKVLGAFLRSHGVSAKARLTRVLSVDLDGDGSDEVILEGSSRDDLLRGGMSAARKGDYSIVLLRYVQKGKVVSRPLEFDHPKVGAMPYMNRILSVGDFDGDGTMEMIVTNAYYEGEGATLYRFKAAKLETVVSNGSGV